MPEIEDERAAAEHVANRANFLLHHRPTNEQRDRIEVALYRNTPLQPLTGKSPGNHGIDANCIDTGLRNIPLVEEPGATRKANHRDRRKLLLQPSRDAPRRLDNPTLEAGLGQDPRPAVE